MSSKRIMLFSMLLGAGVAQAAVNIPLSDVLKVSEEEASTVLAPAPTASFQLINAGNYSVTDISKVRVTYYTGGAACSPDQAKYMFTTDDSSDSLTLTPANNYKTYLDSRSTYWAYSSAVASGDNALPAASDIKYISINLLSASSTDNVNGATASFTTAIESGGCQQNEGTSCCVAVTYDDVNDAFVADTDTTQEMLLHSTDHYIGESLGEGVVYLIKGNSTDSAAGTNYVLSLDDVATGVQWSPSYQNNDTDLWDGNANTYTVLNDPNYPAAAACRSYNPGGSSSGQWFLPAANQWAWLGENYFSGLYRRICG